MNKNVLKKILIAFILFIFFALQAFAQTDAEVAVKMGFKPFQIKDKDGNTINFYISSDNMDFTKKKSWQ